MKSTYKIFTLTILSIALIGGLTSAFKTNEQMTKEQAIKLAEQFIINNGYTSLPADKSKLSYELFDQYENNVDSIPKHRYNTLQQKAFCISEDKDWWDVGFLSTSIDLNKLDSIQRQTNLSGRAVIVMKNGKEIRIAHKEPLFSYFNKL
jgi:DUF4097 and DUF4098 domain-containing protein YvlB